MGHPETAPFSATYLYMYEHVLHQASLIHDPFYTLYKWPAVPKTIQILIPIQIIKNTRKKKQNFFCTKMHIFKHDLMVRCN